MNAIIKQWQQTYQKTIGDNYQYHLKNFFQTVQFEILKAQYSDIIHYIELLRKTGKTYYYLRSHAFAIKWYYQCLVDLEMIAYHPCPNLVLKDQHSTTVNLEKLYTAHELKDFLNRSKKTNSILTKRNQIIRQLIVYQALTNAEIVNLTINQIDLEQCVIHLSKTYLNPRTLDLKAHQLLPLDRYLKKARKTLLKGKKTSLLFVSKAGNPIPSETISAMLNKGFTKKYIPKYIRQSVIVQLLKKGHDLRTIQLFAGYKDITSVERYKHTDLQDLRNALLQKHPLQ